MFTSNDYKQRGIAMKNSKEIWIVIASRAEANIYRVENNIIGSLVCKLEHPESRLQDHELVTSGPGKAYDSMGKGRHMVEPRTSPQKLEFTLFAKDLAEKLDRARIEGLLERFYLVANPSFLGLVRQELNKHTLALLVGEVGKDLTHARTDEMRDYFPPVF